MSELLEIQEVTGGVTAAAGFRAAGVAAGIKRERKDLALILSDTPCQAAATFTTNRVQAAPLQVSREHLQRGPVRAIVCNSGNANACNGPQGLADARRMAALAARAVGVEPHEVLVASTGVIGVPLPMEKIEAGIQKAALALSESGSAAAAEAIMTTDTRPKEAALSLQIGGRSVKVGGIAKGAGMIHPNMATMLAFITTDAAVEKAFLQASLRQAVDRSFNMVSVDGDTSTNDMVVVLANGRAGGETIEAGSAAAWAFQEALTALCIRLARMIAADGEGATKLIEITARGAATQEDARRVVRAIATSPLVKTAVYGEDANWGRILCAAGYSGAAFDPDCASVFLGDLPVYREGSGLPFDETRAKEILRAKEVRITVDLGAGAEEATGWTCDLTYDYIRINASYRS